MNGIEGEASRSRRIRSDRERQAPTSLEVGGDEEGKIEPSHYARYNFALDFVAESDRVLDMPCGTGYGSALLARKSARVLGVDISGAAVGHADEFFRRENVEFVVGNAESLPQEVKGKGPFDVVISFEGIEHIGSPERMLEQIKGVLVKGGRLVISTPRKPHGSPHHVIEFSLDEFVNILKKTGFAVEEVYGQVYTDIFKLSDRPGVDPHSYQKFNFIAVCRNGEGVKE